MSFEKIENEIEKQPNNESVKEGYIYWGGSLIPKKEMEENLMSEEKEDSKEIKIEKENQKIETKEGHIYWDKNFVPKEELKEKMDLKEKSVEYFGIDEAIYKNIKVNLEKGFLESAVSAARIGRVNDETLKEIIKADIEDNFEKRNHKDIFYTLDRFGIEREFLNKEEFIGLAKERIKDKISMGDLERAHEILNDLNIPEKFLDSQEVIRAAERGVQNALYANNIDKVWEIKKAFNLDDDFIEMAVKGEIKILLLEGLAYGAKNLQKKFNISQSFVEEAAQEEILSRIASGVDISNIHNLMEKIEIKKEFLESEAIQEAAKKRVKALIENKEPEKALNLLKMFNISIEGDSGVKEEGIV